MGNLLTPKEVRSCRVLYVDDDTENLFGLKTTFRRQFNILTAISGEEALEIMRQEPVGVLLTDQRMPGMTGVELIQKAKSLYPDTVFLIITAYSDFNAMVEGINTGVLSGYIAKPWEPADVEMTLRTAIERHLLSTRLQARNQDLAHLNLDLERKVEERTKQLQLTVNELNAVNEQLAELNRIKDEFVSICSHDLKSPISALTGFIDLVELRMSRIQGYDGFADTFQSIREVIAEMGSLVDHILDLSRLESGKDELHLAVAQLGEPLNRALSISKPLATSKGVLLNIEREPRLPFLLIDVERMTQVVSNLVSNAVKFTEPGGTVSIRLGVGGDGHQFIEIADTGIGMTQEVCENIFSEGQSHLRPGTGGERSNGMGLCICRRIIEMHGGEITVRSTPGVGSVFRLTLNEPLAEDAFLDFGEGVLAK